MSLQSPKVQELYQRAQKVMPAGVNSNFRYWGPDDTLVAQRAEGGYLWDADGKRYIDYRLGFGPVILGHGYPSVVERVNAAIRERGNIFALTTELEIELAERLARVTGLDKFRLANSGTEATMHALRIARAHTGREKFIKFEGQYHGFCDYFMYSTASSQPAALGSPRSPINVPVSSGIPKGIAEYVVNLPFNDLERLEETIEAQWGDLAAVIVEPMMGNVGGILPRAGWLEKIRELCDRYGIAMIMDEVKTGFRIALGGAQEYFGVRGDLVTYAKSLGNGFPIAVIGGRNEVMDTVRPGEVAHGGTFVGNTVGVAAALATLDVLQSEPVMETIRQRGKVLMSGVGEILSEAGIPNTVLGLPAMFGIYLGDDVAPQDYRGYMKGDGALYERIMHGLAQRGVLPEPDGREPWFLCYAHSEQDIAETLEAFEQAVGEAKA